MIPTQVNEVLKASVHSMPPRAGVLSEEQTMHTIGGISWNEIARWSVPNCNRKRSGWTGVYGGIYKSGCQAQGYCRRCGRNRYSAQYYTCQEYYYNNGRWVKWKEGRGYISC